MGSLYDNLGNKTKPLMPPPGTPEWIEKGYPRHENPNWWQKIMNWLFAAREA